MLAQEWTMSLDQAIEAEAQAQAICMQTRDFERAYRALKVGEISQPVRTPFGYHLIQVLERRSADMSPERRRLQARQILRERKADEAYQEWLRQLRDAVYVELRLEER